MTIDGEMLAAYAEDQLDETDRARVEAALAVDPALAEDLARHRALRERLQAHFAPVLSMPMPGRLTAAARNQASAVEVIDLNAARAARTEKARHPSLTRWITGSAIAASLALGMVLGNQMTDNSPVGSAGGRLVAQGALGTALTTQHAATNGQPVHILLSLRTASGRYCRVFQTDAMTGLACRGDNGWGIDRMQSGGTAASGPYRQAGSPLGEIMAAAQDMAPAGAMDAAQERAAIAKGWK